MNLEELGAALRTERERRGLGIEDVANALKIGARQLRALEEADLSALPHVAYTRGFIRSYATYLGFSQAEIEEVLHCLAPQENIVASQAVYTPAEESDGASAGKAFSLIVVLLILLGGGYFLWNSGLARKGMDMLSGAGTDAPQVAQPSGLAEEEKPSASVDDARKDNAASRKTPEAAAPAADPAPASTSAAPAPAAQPAATTTTPARTTPAAPAAATTAATETSAAATETADAAEADADVRPGQHKVIIIATEECWIHSSADKTDVRQFSLNKGDTFALTFSTRLELKLGNAGGVRIRYDGKEMPPAGTSGQVRNLVFPPQN